MPNLLRFVPFASNIDPSFWSEFSKQKIDVLKLSDAPLNVKATYRNGTTPVSLNFDFASLQSNAVSPTVAIDGTVEVLVSMLNSNTLVQYKVLDRKKLFEDVAEEIRNAVASGAALDSPHLLMKGLLLTFADLKKYHFYSLFGVPALRFPKGEATLTTPPLKVSDNDHLHRQIKKLSTLLSTAEASPFGFTTVLSAETEDVAVYPLKEYPRIHEEQKASGMNANVLIGFCDAADGEHPCWTLRNLLVLVAHQFKVQTLKVLCFRERGAEERSKSIILDVSLPEVDSLTTNAVGWETDPRYPTKTKTKCMKLNEQMDPVALATSASDLNLKLMRWRMFHDIDLDLIKTQRCLLLGAGTLGCNVARTLLGWGVRKITFVDRAKVSFSNPVRQSLFTFEDCISPTGGEYKAIAAAKMLKKIFPTVDATGVVLTIPMAGHSVDVKNVEWLAQVKHDYEVLEQLIREHDAIFLLGDSKEVRWLPTVIGQSMNKLVISAGLGFDSYVVMRHGVDDEEHPERQKLSCYFCADLSAPKDTVSDRSLDQACTVTRPGISMFASALAVELFVSILHHPMSCYPTYFLNNANAKKQAWKCINLILNRALAPAGVSTTLGSVPHQLLGFLSQWNNTVVTGHAYDKCIACSKMVVERYKRDKFEFVLEALNSPEFLEELTGLKKEKECAAEWVCSAEDDF